MVSIRAHLYAMTFGLGIALAGMAGGLYGMVSQITSVYRRVVDRQILRISIIGGLDNPLGVHRLGGLFIGIVESLTTLYIGPDLYRCRQLRHPGADADRAARRLAGKRHEGVRSRPGSGRSVALAGRALVRRRTC